MKQLIKYIFVLLASSMLMLSCSKSENPEPNTNEYVNAWILDNMSFWYLWNSNIPSGTNNTFNPDKYFESLLYKYGQTDGDRFSWIQDNFMELLNSLSGVVKEAGYDYTLIGIENSNELIGVVNYVKPQSPAATAGLKRGDYFLKINGTQLTRSNYTNLISALNSNHTLRRAAIENGIISEANEISLTVVEYHENPIYHSAVYTVNNKKIGYLVYNFFSADDGDGSKKYDFQLNNVFGQFKQANITDLILDLRYNSGGSVTSAINLASMIVPNIKTTDVFSISKYNSVAQSEIIKYYGEEFLIDYFNKYIQNTSINNIGVNNLYILTGYRTASASELIINGLKPYINNVFLIGEKTVGKNVASITIYEDNDANNKWGMQPIVCKITNKNGFSEFENGFIPDIEMDEYGGFTSTLKELGDPEELMLAAALNYIVFGTMPDVKKRAQQYNIIPVKNERGMYFESEKFKNIGKD